MKPTSDQKVMWQALGHLGVDLDGDGSPAASIAGMGEEGFRLWFLRTVAEIAKEHDEAIDEVCMNPAAHKVHASPDGGEVMEPYSAHCPDCGSFLVTCNVCQRTFVVQNVGVGKDFSRGELLTHQQRAQNAAVWHVYDEHRETWIATIGDRPPQDDRLFAAIP